jgi:hypothetical protein
MNQLLFKERKISIKIRNFFIKEVIKTAKQKALSIKV